MTQLQLHSEKFSADGNMSAEGVEKLLGAPTINLLSVLVREATQNACDAASDSPEGCRMKWRVRQLTPEELEVFRSSIFSPENLPQEEHARGLLESFLNDPEWQWVLEICDFGTTGLQGPTRADAIAGVENPDFVNFFRNMGAPRDVDGGGGTYGYGKSTFFRGSRCHTIVVDTLTTNKHSEEERRLMAMQLGQSVPGKWTGRHWWGVFTSDGKTVDPVRFREARELAHALGFPPRQSGRAGRGTSIMVLAPVFLPVERPEEDPWNQLHLFSDEGLLMAAVEEHVLWNFWPRMVQGTPREERLEAQFWRNGVWEKNTQPEDMPPLQLMARALELAKGSHEQTEDDEEVQDIRSERPARHLGRLAFVKAPWKQRRYLLPRVLAKAADSDLRSPFPERCHHVALMRPFGMVVKYLDNGLPDPDESREWAGVFRCSEDTEVEEAFARAEPPAHDGWRPEFLPSRSWERRYVNIALRKVRAVIGSRHKPDIVHEEDEMPLGRLSDRLGQFLLGDVNDQKPGRKPPEGSGGGGARRRPFDTPAFIGLMEKDGKILSRYHVNVHVSVEVKGKPGVLLEGRNADPDEITGIPEIEGWYPENGDIPLTGPQVVLSPGGWEVHVSVPGQVAVTLSLEEAGEN